MTLTAKYVKSDQDMIVKRDFSIIWHGLRNMCQNVRKRTKVGSQNFLLSITSQTTKVSL